MFESSDNRPIFSANRPISVRRFRDSVRPAMPAMADASDRPSTVQPDKSGRPAIHPIIVRPFPGIVRSTKPATIIATTTTAMTATTIATATTSMMMMMTSPPATPSRSSTSSVSSITNSTSGGGGSEYGSRRQ